MRMRSCVHVATTLCAHAQSYLSHDRLDCCFIVVALYYNCQAVLELCSHGRWNGLLQVENGATLHLASILLITKYAVRPIDGKNMMSSSSLQNSNKPNAPPRHIIPLTIYYASSLVMLLSIWLSGKLLYKVAVGCSWISYLIGRLQEVDIKSPRQDHERNYCWYSAIYLPSIGKLRNNSILCMHAYYIIATTISLETSKSIID